MGFGLGCQLPQVGRGGVQGQREDLVVPVAKPKDTVAGRLGAQPVRRLATEAARRRSARVCCAAATPLAAAAACAGGDGGVGGAGCPVRISTSGTL